MLLMKNKLQFTVAGILLVFAFALFSITATAPAATNPETMYAVETTTDDSARNTTACKHPTAMWGDPNPNVYYICDAAGRTALQLRCPVGCGYFNGLGYYGCIPYEQWPACITTPKVDEQHPLICDSDHMQQPWEAIDPNKFHMCSTLDTQPLLFSCAKGRGFLQSKIVGCASWDQWRTHKQCVDFY